MIDEACRDCFIHGFLPCFRCFVLCLEQSHNSTESSSKCKIPSRLLSARSTSERWCRRLVCGRWDDDGVCGAWDKSAESDSWRWSLNGGVNSRLDLVVIGSNLGLRALGWDRGDDVYWDLGLLCNDVRDCRLGGWWLVGLCDGVGPGNMLAYSSTKSNAWVCLLGDFDRFCLGDWDDDCVAGADCGVVGHRAGGCLVYVGCLVDGGWVALDSRGESVRLLNSEIS